MNKPVPQIIQKVGFDFHWDEAKVWELDIKTEKVPISQLTWHFAVPFWNQSPGGYNLKPHEVINNPKEFSAEFQRIKEADISIPQDIMYWKGRWLILDGLHRLAKLFIQKKRLVNVRKIPHYQIPKILSTPLDEGVSWISPKATLRKSPIEGKGLFANENITSGEVIVVWQGVYTDKKGAKQAKKNGKLVMQWDENIFSVEERADDPGYFINHSCESNLWMEDAYTLIVRKPIKTGEEITADYALWEADEKYVSKWICNCGSKYCRGYVTGQDWKKTDIQQRYANHFSPLINKRITNNA